MLIFYSINKGYTKASAEQKAIESNPLKQNPNRTNAGNEIHYGIHTHMLLAETNLHSQWIIWLYLLSLRISVKQV